MGKCVNWIRRERFESSGVWVIFDHRHVTYFRYLQIPGRPEDYTPLNYARIMVRIKEEKSLRQIYRYTVKPA